MSSKEKQSKSSSGQSRIFLEIGPGAYPTAAQSSRRYIDDNVYVGVENNTGDYRDSDMFAAQKRHVGARVLQENVILTKGDGRNLHFPNRSVHEVFMGNVLNGVNAEDIPAFLSEAHRVMDGSGPLVIDVEDQVAGDFMYELRDELEAAGFKPGEVVEKAGPDADEWQKLNGEWPSAMWPEDHTFLIAQKLPEIPGNESMQ